MSKMKIAPEDRPIVKAECLRMMVNLGLDEARTQLLSGFVDTYLRLDPIEETVFQEKVAEFAPPEEEQAMEIVTSWMEKGIEEGLKRGREEGRSEVMEFMRTYMIQQGIEEGLKRGRDEALQLVPSWKQEGIEIGRREGERTVLYRLLRRRCGELPENVIARLNILTTSQMEDLADFGIDFMHINDLNDWLDANA